MTDERCEQELVKAYVAIMEEKERANRLVFAGWEPVVHQAEELGMKWCGCGEDCAEATEELDSKSEAEEFRDEVEKAMDYERLIRFERNGREYTVDSAHVAMVEMYQAYRGEKIW